MPRRRNGRRQADRWGETYGKPFSISRRPAMYAKRKDWWALAPSLRDNAFRAGLATAARLGRAALPGRR